MKLKLILLGLTLSPMFAAGAFALTINGTAPSSDDPVRNEALRRAFDRALADLNKEVGRISPRPAKMAKAFADSAAFSNHAATQRGYMDYSKFAVTAGTMAGFQLPGLSGNEFTNFADDLKENGDARFGANYQVWAAELGINASFLLEGLYFGLKFGLCSLDIPLDEHRIKYDYWSLGLLAKYRFLGPKSAAGLVSWKGMSVGSGILYQYTKTNYIMRVGDVDVNESGANVKIDSDVDFAMKYNGVTVPLEIMTGVNLLKIITLHAGVGVDINLIYGKMSIGAKGRVYSNEADRDGSISLSEGMDNIKPSYLRPKLMAGIGVGLGPVVVDIPVTYYIKNGFNVGVSLGFIW